MKMMEDFELSDVEPRQIAFAFTFTCGDDEDRILVCWDSSEDTVVFVEGVWLMRTMLEYTGTRSLGSSSGGGFWGGLVMAPGYKGFEYDAPK